MLAETFTVDIGAGLQPVLMAAVGLAGTWLGTRKVRKQMETNGGSTLRDAVNRIEANSARIEAKVDSQKRRLDAAGIAADPLTDTLPPPDPPPAPPV